MLLSPHRAYSLKQQWNEEESEEMHKSVSSIIKCKLFNDTTNMVNSHWQLAIGNWRALHMSSNLILQFLMMKNIEYHKLMGK